MIEVTYQMIVDGLHQAVRERGADYVYRTPPGAQVCLYWHPEAGEPGCIVGYVFHNLGVSKDYLILCNPSGAPQLIAWLVDWGVISFPNEAEKILVSSLLTRVQSRQDEPKPWGDAVYGALEEVNA
ncbi:MAG: hypothetical protein EHM35_12890 [Planctomycetaceae bacterium]|nr:MAG: hypothetical protein EHM35_12890 [Planctomycetaceae bacterium]